MRARALRKHVEDLKLAHEHIDHLAAFRSAHLSRRKCALSPPAHPSPPRPLTPPAPPFFQVRLHVSTLQRAKETADIIAAALPSGRVRRLPPDANLAEGYPPAHRIPYSKGAVSAHDSLLSAGCSSFPPMPLHPPSPSAHERSVRRALS